jgi:nondiscriminating glutamyl-tRNA synthetase
MKQSCRVRFAPSPTGIMHIGNVRTALLNYIFALHYQGTFILRVEDTDQERNIDPQSIFDHLGWLGLTYQEGPHIGGNYGPYFQSQRHDVYTSYLHKLQATNHVYRCFCTQEQLEIKRNRQIALKTPPRYDKTCSKLSLQDIQERLQTKTPFFWRMKINETESLQFHDLGHGKLNFELKNFSDFAITRTDGSFTFMFANCIDDITMQISHILRGQDHLTNTVGQLTIMQALDHPFPTFWHLPILFNTQGKKLSKRDQGFSLDDLRNDGFLPEAIVNYLGIIGSSFEKEIMSIEEMAQAYNFDNMHTSNQIKYDIEKMRWINHKWIAQTPINKLINLCKPFLTAQFDISTISDTTLQTLIQSVQTDIVTLKDIPSLLQFYFKKPVITQETLNNFAIDQTVHDAVMNILTAQQNQTDFATFFNLAKQQAAAENIPLKDFFSITRLYITGSPKGLGIGELEKCLGFAEIKNRLYVPTN